MTLRRYNNNFHNSNEKTTESERKNKKESGYDYNYKTLI